VKVKQTTGDRAVSPKGGGNRTRKRAKPECIKEPCHADLVCGERRGGKTKRKKKKNKNKKKKNTSKKKRNGELHRRVALILGGKL